jgi:Uma2 family endonuclease
VVTRTAHAIDFSTFPSDDGEPMAETEPHRKQMVYTLSNLDDLLVDRPRVYVGGNMLMYYNQGFGRDHVSADVFVTFDVPRGVREKWETWNEQGRFADVVFEMTSESTYQEDLGKKRRLYARLGVQELYLYDPLQQVQPFFRAFRLIEGDLVELPAPVRGSYYSPLLGTELRVIGQWLRVMDPATGQPFPLPEEVKAALQREIAARQAAEKEREREAIARQAAEERERQEAIARQAAEERERQEAAARQAAEARAARMEAQNAADRAELARLRVLLAQQQGQTE